MLNDRQEFPRLEAAPAQASPGTFLDHLVARRRLTADQARDFADSAARHGRSIVAEMYQASLLDPRDVARELASHTGLSPVEDADWPAEPVLMDRLSLPFLTQNEMMPLALSGDGRLVVAVADPEAAGAIAMLRVAAQRDVWLRLAAPADILAALQRLSRRRDTVEPERAAPVAASEDMEQLNDLALEAPVIELVNRLLLEAAVSRATDLHLEAARNRVVLRRRVDGLLQDVGTLTPAIGRAAVSRIKILARLNIAERRLPQDGQARVRLNDRDYDLRVATVPTVHGESAAIRLLAAAAQIPDLARLGMNARDAAAWRRGLAAPHGLIVVTGPTGSGKTTTLAASLSALNEPHRKIITIEDPVEYQIDGVNQIQVKPDIGMTFSHALRSILRHDPDIIMVGEIRDAETASIAIQSALTGHLVLTTLHTNSAAGAVTRLLDMGIQSYLLASALRCVTGQRLVRALCPACRQPDEGRTVLPAEAMAEAGIGLGEAHGFRAVGCERCGGAGYVGRLPIFEVLACDDPVQAVIRPDASLAAIEAAARRSGMTSMMTDGIAKWRAGLTSADELVRVALNE